MSITFQIVRKNSKEINYKFFLKGLNKNWSGTTVNTVLINVGGGAESRAYILRNGERGGTCEWTKRIAKTPSPLFDILLITLGICDHARRSKSGPPLVTQIVPIKWWRSVSITFRENSELHSTSAECRKHADWFHVHMDRA